MEVDVWTGRTARALRHAMLLTQEAFAEHLHVGTRTVADWETTKLGRALSAHAHQVLYDTLNRAPVPARSRFAAVLEQEGTSLRRSTISDSPREVIMAAAHESAEDAASRASCGGESIADLHDRTAAAARAYSSRPPLDVFVDTRAVRDLACSLTECTRRPSDLADLYVVLGETNALMGSIAFDLGNWPAAATLARSATTYAELASHNSLMAWTLGLQGTLAFWRDEPRRALEFIARGLAVAPKGAPRYRLQHIKSRAHAIEGNAAAVEDALAAAQADANDRHAYPDELDREVKGEFTFDDARASACAAAAWLHMYNGEQAAIHARRALDSYATVPESRRPFSPVAGVTIDLAAAHLLAREYDEAAGELESVFSLPQELRNVSLAGRIAKIRDILHAPGLARQAPRQLTTRVIDWLNDTAAKPDAVDGVT
ncbi:helix-turn-helix domain-containing protein [Nonomuraea sp. CA-143628]|uniref:helix-turn-helix domain-containing protein n=1 Tax=Nonomuraea sp. CA-143628 TaxID=3239997 RepID=UPI003D92DB31